MSQGLTDSVAAVAAAADHDDDDDDNDNDDDDDAISGIAARDLLTDPQMIRLARGQRERERIRVKRFA